MGNRALKQGNLHKLPIFHNNEVQVVKFNLYNLKKYINPKIRRNNIINFSLLLTKKKYVVSKKKLTMLPPVVAGINKSGKQIFPGL